MGGAQPLAATMAGASLLADRMPAHRASRCACAPAISTSVAKDLDEALAIIERSCRGAQAGLGRRARQRRGDPARARAPRRPARHRHRPDLGARSGQRLSARRAGRSREWEERRASDPEGGRARRQGVDGASTSGHAGFHAHGRADLRLRQQHPPDGARGRASRTPSTFPASCRPISARCSAAASARSAGRRCRAIRRTSSGPTPRSRS